MNTRETPLVYGQDSDHYVTSGDWMKAAALKHDSDLRSLPREVPWPHRESPLGRVILVRDLPVEFLQTLPISLWLVTIASLHSSHLVSEWPGLAAVRGEGGFSRETVRGRSKEAIFETLNSYNQWNRMVFIPERHLHLLGPTWNLPQENEYGEVTP